MILTPLVGKGPLSRLPRSTIIVLINRVSAAINSIYQRSVAPDLIASITRIIYRGWARNDANDLIFNEITNSLNPRRKATHKKQVNV